MFGRAERCASVQPLTHYIFFASGRLLFGRARRNGPMSRMRIFLANGTAATKAGQDLPQRKVYFGQIGDLANDPAPTSWNSTERTDTRPLPVRAP